MSQFIPVCEPFLDGNELKYVTDAVETGWISSAGKYVTAFEQQFAAYCGCKYGVAVCNGTVALHLALVALGIGKGDEVISPSFRGTLLQPRGANAQRERLLVAL